MLDKQKQSEMELGAGQVKVKISHVHLSNYDAFLYTGDKKIVYPKTIGRFAIGIVTETGANGYGIKKGSRVYMKATLPCGKCFACKSGDRANCTSPKTACSDFDGFLRDFAVCDYADVSVIPDSISDMHALCIESVALAENIFDNLHLSTGGKVAIAGAGFLGSIFTQVALYHKLTPIVIDNHPQNIERMQKSGAFFSFAADDSLVSNVNNATSGTLCDAAIYTSSCKLPFSVPASVLARGKNLVLGGFSPVNLTMDTAPIFEKNLKVYAVSDGYGYIETAINMLVHGVLDLSNFEKEVLKEFNPEALLAERAKNSSYTSKMTVLKLIM